MIGVIFRFLPIITPIASFSFQFNQNRQSLKYCNWYFNYCYCLDNPSSTRVPYTLRNSLICGNSIPSNCLVWQRYKKDNCNVCWNPEVSTHVRIPVTILQITKLTEVNKVRCLETTCTSSYSRCLEFKSNYTLPRKKSLILSGVSRLTDYVRRAVLSSSNNVVIQNFWNPWSGWTKCGHHCQGASTKQRTVWTNDYVLKPIDKSKLFIFF